MFKNYNPDQLLCLLLTNVLLQYGFHLKIPSMSATGSYRQYLHAA
jgi:hypothetical protein